MGLNSFSRGAARLIPQERGRLGCSPRPIGLCRGRTVPVPVARTCMQYSRMALLRVRVVPPFSLSWSLEALFSCAFVGSCAQSARRAFFTYGRQQARFKAQHVLSVTRC